MLRFLALTYTMLWCIAAVLSALVGFSMILDAAVDTHLPPIVAILIFVVSGMVVFLLNHESEADRLEDELHEMDLRGFPFPDPTTLVKGNTDYSQLERIMQPPQHIGHAEMREINAMLSRMNEEDDAFAALVINSMERDPTFIHRLSHDDMARFIESPAVQNALSTIKFR